MLYNNTPAIPRLHIPEYNWWNEALHGAARSGIATVFPQPIGMAATLAPLFALKGFQRVSLAAGASVRLKFILGPEQYSLVGKDGRSSVPPGKIRISVAGSLPTQRSEVLGAAKGVETEWEVLGK